MALYGLNLGGWLVAEKWMTPSLFKNSEARNEYELAQKSTGKKRLKAHHEQFITEQDIAWIKRQGIELVRVPIGHWIFGDAPPYVGSINRLDWLMQMAQKYNLQVLLTLHGAPGAQNAEAHSGSGNWPRRSSVWLDDKLSQADAIAVLKRLAKRYGSNRQLWGIELLNEPLVDIFGIKLVRFYRQAALAIHPLLHKNVNIVFSDGFHPLLITGALWPLKLKGRPIIMDMHRYYCFTKRPNVHIAMRQVRASRYLLRFLQVFQPVMIGEWSGAVGSYESPKKTRQFIATQNRVYNTTAASCYWSYKTEMNGKWNFRTMIERAHMAE